MIYITGDIHGEVFPVAEAVERFGITNEDVIVILGDVGMNYYGNNHGDRHRKKKLNKLGVPIFCIHGNHEMRPSTIDTYHQVQWHGGTIYVEDEYPQVFTQPDTEILTVLPERTFWEKVTILHKEAFRTNGNFPARYSRHYYDLCCMDRSDVKGKAYADQDLLERVVLFKARFYPAGNAHYDEAKPGTMRLMPPGDCMKQLRDDYDHMRNMIYGFRPEFDEVMKCIQRLEQEINKLSK